MPLCFTIHSRVGKLGEIVGEAPAFELWMKLTTGYHSAAAMYPAMYATLALNLSWSDDAPRIPDDALSSAMARTYAPVIRNDRIHLASIYARRTSEGGKPLGIFTSRLTPRQMILRQQQPN
jgi:hypothetical protein